MRDDICTGSSRHTLWMSAGRVVHGPTVAGGREASYVCRTRSTASSIDSLLQPMTARGRGSGDLCKFPDVVQDSHLCQWLVPALGGASAWGTVPGPVAVTEPGASDLRSATVIHTDSVDRPCSRRSHACLLPSCYRLSQYSSGAFLTFLVTLFTSVSWVPYSGTSEG